MAFVILCLGCNLSALEARENLSTLSVDKSGEKNSPRRNFRFIWHASHDCLFFRQNHNILIPKDIFLTSDKSLKVLTES
jgi:hypothetical protein